MIRVLASVALCIALLAASVAARAASYYVAPNGDDGAAGMSVSEPWRTIDRANQRLEAGDTVYIRAGDYAGDPIEPERSGTANAYITYTAYEGERPVLTGANVAIVLEGRSYIRISGLDVDGKRRWDDANIKTWMEIRGGGHNLIQDTRFRHAKGWYGARLDEDTHHNILRGNEFDFVGTWSDGSGSDTDKGDVLGIIGGANRNLIENNVFTHGGHNLLIVRSSYNVIRNNVFDNDWSDVEVAGRGNRNLSIAGGRYNLFEGNIVRNAGKASDNGAPPAMKVEGRNQIVRRNVIANNVHEAISTSARSGQPHASGNRIYHNTIYGNGGPAWRLSLYESSLEINDNVFMNNIVADNRRAPASSDLDADTVWNFNASGIGLGSNRLINNIITCANCEGVHNLEGVAGAISAPDAEKSYPKNFVSTLEGKPQFVGVDTADLTGFALTPGSPGIDEGAPLTATVTGGSGKVVKVDDAGFFFDGGTIVTGDMVAIGDDRHVRVLDVDYGADTLVLGKEISWSAGEPVSLAYSGDAPDVGAMESGASGKRPMAPKIK